MIIYQELNPSDVFEIFQNSQLRNKSFTYEGICAIFEFFEEQPICEEWEKFKEFDIIKWDSMFIEFKKPKKQEKDKLFKKYIWAQELENGNVIVCNDIVSQ